MTLGDVPMMLAVLRGPEQPALCRYPAHTKALGQQELRGRSLPCSLMMAATAVSAGTFFPL